MAWHDNPLCVFRGSYCAERISMYTLVSYFEKQDDMLDFIKGEESVYTPMRWDKVKKMYIVDFDSADILGM